MEENTGGWLSENFIKKHGLAFLRSYYKNRHRIDARPTKLAMDAEVGDGIVVDGYIRIPMVETDNDFVSTFEASSVEKIAEVRFKTYVSVVFWDSLLLFSSLFFSLLLINYAVNPPFLPILFYENLFAAALGAYVSLFLLIFALSFSFSRYKYIYAIQKFRNYPSHENWIIVSDELIRQLKTTEYAELKRQCIEHKVGLVLIDLHANQQLLITPGRTIDYAKKPKRRIYFYSFALRIKSIIHTFCNGILAIFPQFFSSQSKRFKLYPSYQQFVFPFQFFFSLFFLILSYFLLQNDQRQTQIIFVNEKEYQQKMESASQKLSAETADYFEDSTAIIPYESKR